MSEQPKPDDSRLACGRAQAALQAAPTEAAVQAMAATLLELARRDGVAVEQLVRKVTRLVKAGE